MSSCHNCGVYIERVITLELFRDFHHYHIFFCSSQCMNRWLGKTGINQCSLYYKNNPRIIPHPIQIFKAVVGTADQSFS